MFIPMEQIYKKNIFFRNDDVAELNENLKMLVNIFIAYRVPLHLAVIPTKLTSECREFLLEKIEESQGLIEIGQHGYTHTNYSSSEGKLFKYEFGSKRSFEQQRDDIAEGNAILQSSFQRTIDIFTPPWHGFDHNTLNVLIDKGFTAISFSDNEVDCNPYIVLDSIPININFNKINEIEGGWYIESNENIIKNIYRNKDLNIGILLHHNSFNGQEEFRQLDRLLHFLKKNECIEFIHLSESRKSFSNKDLIFREALTYYLNYQFVPKPLTVTSDSSNSVVRQFDFKIKEAPPIHNVSEPETCERIYNCLKGVIEKQLPEGNVPIGLLLSGGIDSAIILHLLRELTDRTIYTLTGAYRGNAENLHAAQVLADEYNTIHQGFIINPESLSRMDELYNKNIPQPIGDNGFLSTYLMIEQLKHKAKYVFSGDGADCLFSGLRMHYLNSLEKNEGAFAHYRFGEIFLEDKDKELIFENGLKDICLTDPIDWIIKDITTSDPIKRQIILDLRFLVRNRIDYILFAASTNNVDIQLPFLNNDFIELVLSVPEEFLSIQSGLQKRLLRKTFQGKLPQYVIDRQSEGFTPPFKAWYYTNMKWVIQKLIKSKKLGISAKYIKYLIQNFKNCDSYVIGMKIWLILNLVSWYEVYSNRINKRPISDLKNFSMNIEERKIVKVS